MLSLIIGMRIEDGLHNFHEGDFNIFFSFWQHAFLVLAGLFPWLFYRDEIDGNKNMRDTKFGGKKIISILIILLLCLWTSFFLAAMAEQRENGNTFIQPNYQLKWLCTTYTSLQQQRFTNTRVSKLTPSQYEFDT